MNIRTLSKNARVYIAEAIGTEDSTIKNLTALHKTHAEAMEKALAEFNEKAHAEAEARKAEKEAEEEAKRQEAEAKEAPKTEEVPDTNQGAEEETKAPETEAPKKEKKFTAKEERQILEGAIISIVGTVDDPDHIRFNADGYLIWKFNGYLVRFRCSAKGAKIGANEKASKHLAGYEVPMVYHENWKVKYEVGGAVLDIIRYMVGLEAEEFNKKIGLTETQGAEENGEEA